MADNWLSNAWEWIVPGEDDQGMFANIGDWWGGDDDYDDSVSIADFDQELIDELLGEIESAGGLDSFLPTQDIDWNNFIDWGDEDPAYSIDMNWLDEMPEETGIFSGDNFPRLAGFFNSLLGGANTAAGNVGSGLGGLFNSTLGQLAMLNYMKNKNKDYMDVPVGWGDGGGEGGSPIDYRVFNLQPALMPGVAYANVGTQSPPTTPPGMKDGGLTGLSQKIGEGIDNYAISPYLAEVGFFEDPSFSKYVEGARLYNQNTKAPSVFKSAAPLIDDSFEALQDGYEAFLKSFRSKRGLGSAMGVRRAAGKPEGMKGGGLGDITLARLEPGEFVITKKATDNIGAQNLYKMMKQAEGMG
jgi:hypothetical protein